MTAKGINFKVLLMSGIILWTCILSAQSDSATAWKLEKNQNGVQVYTRKIKGFKLKEFRALTTVEASPEFLLDIIRAVDKYTDWMSHLEGSYIVKEVNENEIYVYTESDVPWPFSNRDIVTHSLLYWEGEKAMVKMTGMPEYIPVNKGIVRVPKSRGFWVFEPDENGHTTITYQFQGDPGGKIPSWVANIFIVDGPYKSLLGIRKIVENQD